jgi:hypothetical protein
LHEYLFQVEVENALLTVPRAFGNPANKEKKLKKEARSQRELLNSQEGLLRRLNWYMRGLMSIISN